MGEWLKKRQGDPARDRPIPGTDGGDVAGLQQDADASRSATIVRTLQQGAGNAAIASLMSAPSAAPAGVQRATKPGDELMNPNADATPAPSGISADDEKIIQQIVGTDGSATTADSGAAPGTATTAVDTGAASASASATVAATDTSTGERALFDQTILDPIRSIYAVLRDEPPDFELAAKKFGEIGMTLMEYQNRYEKSNPELYYMMMAIRGWIGRPYNEILARNGSGKPMSDRSIAEAVSDLIPDLNAFRAKLP